MIDDTPIPIEQARALFGELLGTPGEVGTSLEIESFDDERLVTESGGVRSVCTR